MTRLSVVRCLLSLLSLLRGLQTLWSLLRYFVDASEPIAIRALLIILRQPYCAVYDVSWRFLSLSRVLADAFEPFASFTGAFEPIAPFN